MNLHGVSAQVTLRGVPHGRWNLPSVWLCRAALNVFLGQGSIHVNIKGLSTLAPIGSSWVHLLSWPCGFHPGGRSPCVSCGPWFPGPHCRPCRVFPFQSSFSPAPRPGHLLCPYLWAVDDWILNPARSCPALLAGSPCGFPGTCHSPCPLGSWVPCCLSGTCHVPHVWRSIQLVLTQEAGCAFALRPVITPFPCFYFTLSSFPSGTLDLSQAHPSFSCVSDKLFFLPTGLPPTNLSLLVLAGSCVLKR